MLEKWLEWKNMYYPCPQSNTALKRISVFNLYTRLSILYKEQQDWWYWKTDIILSTLPGILRTPFVTINTKAHCCLQINRLFPEHIKTKLLWRLRGQNIPDKICSVMCHTKCALTDNYCSWSNRLMSFQLWKLRNGPRSRDNKIIRLVTNI